MPFRLTPVVRAAAPAFRTQQRAAFSSTTLRFAGKETAEHNEARKAEIEKAKQEQLQGSKDGSNKWKSELASESESAVQGEKEAHGKSIDQLQKESAAAAKKSQ